MWIFDPLVWHLPHNERSWILRQAYPLLSGVKRLVATISEGWTSVLEPEMGCEGLVL